MAKAGDTMLKWHGERLKQVLGSAEGRMLHAIGRECVSTIKSSMGPSVSRPGEPPGRDTGSYARSMDSEVALLRKVTRVGTNDVRGPWLELGTGSRAVGGGQPYVIRPRYKKALAFRVGGQTVVRASVLHPGIHPRPHIVSGVLASKRAIEAIVKHEGEGIR